MVKILSRSGTSLADMYDVEGSIAGIESLESREVTLIHEMGATLFAERYVQSIRRATSGDILQNASFNVVISNMPSSPFRIFNVFVFATVNGRVELASIAIRSEGQSREVPIWAWDSAIDTDLLRIRMEDDGGGVIQHRVLVPTASLANLPSMGTGTDQLRQVDEIAFRGSTTGFGAGTVAATMVMLIGFTDIGGIASRGLPVPSW